MRTATLPLLLLASTLALASTAKAQPRCQAPQVLLIVDKSSSMLGNLPEGMTKWDAARFAIRELVVDFHDNIDFGLQPFPLPSRCQPGEVTIDVGRNDAETILGGLGEPPPTGGSYTPMAQTLDVAAEYAPLSDPDHDNHVILITDGWQWCSPYDPATRFTPVESVTHLAAMGITVHVVGFGAAVDSLTLNRAAVAAGTALPGCDPTASDPSDPDNCYQQADDLDGLRTALSSIARYITDEMCDGFDNDCDGLTDEGFDVDGDTYTTCGTDVTIIGRTDPDLADCDDAEERVHPGAAEVCDGLDNDCDGSVDPGCSCTDGETRPCGSDIGACSSGMQVCAGGAWGECADALGPGVESCEGTDEDCDGEVDEGAECGPGFACIDGGCVDITEPEPEPPPPPPEEPEQPDLGPSVPMDGGCGCVVAGTKPSGAGQGLGLAAVALLAGVLIWRRRRGR